MSILSTILFAVDYTEEGWANNFGDPTITMYHKLDKTLLLNIHEEYKQDVNFRCLHVVTPKIEEKHIDKIKDVISEFSHYCDEDDCLVIYTHTCDYWSGVTIKSRLLGYDYLLYANYHYLGSSKAIEDVELSDFKRRLVQEDMMRPRCITPFGYLNK